MILFLVHFLRDVLHLQLPTVFSYYSTRMALAALTSMAICIFFGPMFIRKLYAMKIGQPIRKDECPLLGELHSKKENTPTMGGVLVLVAMLVSLALWMDWKSAFTLILLIATIWLGLLGAADDYLKLKHKNSKGLAGRKKMAWQLLFAGLLGLYLLFPTVADGVHVGRWFSPPVAKERMASAYSLDGDKEELNKARPALGTRDYTSHLYIPFVKKHLLTFSGFFLVLLWLLIVFVVVGSSNAVNLTDGLDGLAAGCLMFAAGALALIAFMQNHVGLAEYLHIIYIEGSGEVAIYLSAMVGACLGFLWYNGHPAQVFLGDTGALALGGILGVAAVLMKRELLFAIIGGVFVAEALSVIVQVGGYKFLNRKRFFRCAPLHHHFEYKGWPETKVVVRFWIVGLLLAIVGVASLKFQ
ncbi:phospho-N-acetylmuramoyl-pentapeptide-transferase [Simkania negevensis]|uniref:Phospho-N-acetylmuramoyl-pentapeptide-transferase n=1 Tax=Simkania negevensis TaxID=83561 RepID=A0ABS3AQ80_9BACT|nr:phospho-N-acetylmuramoyl-pentapeptide-transferase [Simkania negevensis]